MYVVWVYMNKHKICTANITLNIIAVSIEFIYLFIIITGQAVTFTDYAQGEKIQWG